MQFALSITDPPCLDTEIEPTGSGLSRIARWALIGSAVMTLSACASGGGKGGVLRDIPVVTDPAPIVAGTMRPYTIRGRTYRPAEQPNYNETGIASWYGQYHHGRATSTGEIFDMNALTAAHKTLPLPSMVEVTNTANGRRVLVRVNDRGPFADNRIIDLSRGAADALGLRERGLGEVRVRYAGRAPRRGGGAVLTGGGSRSAAPAGAPATVASPSASATARPYNEVVRQQPPVAQAPRAVAESSRSNVPIPQQPLPPAMPSRDATLTLTPSATVPSPYTTEAVQPIAPVAPRYRVQVISFDDRAFADGIARRLGGDTVVESYVRNGRTLYRVVTGSYADTAAAEHARQAVIARGFGDALLIAD